MTSRRGDRASLAAGRSRPSPLWRRRERGARPRRHGGVGLRPHGGAAHHRPRAWRNGPPGRPTGRGWPTSRRSDGYRQLFVRTLATRRGAPADPRPPRRHPAGLVARRPPARLRPRRGRQRQARAGRPQRLVLRGRRRLEHGPGVGAGAPARAPTRSGRPGRPTARRLAFDAAWAGPRRIWISDSAGTESAAAHLRFERGGGPRGPALVAGRPAARLPADREDDVRYHHGGGRHGRDGARDATMRRSTSTPPGRPTGAGVYFASSRGGGTQRLAHRGRRRRPRRRAAPSSSPPAQATTSSRRHRPTAHRLAFAVRGLNADLWQLPVSPETGAAHRRPRTAGGRRRPAWRAAAPGRPTGERSPSTRTAKAR